MRIDFKYRENERKMMAEMYQMAAAILKAAKAEILPYDPTFMGVPGQAIHEHSTCRMGAAPKRSALNGFFQMHDVKNEGEGGVNSRNATLTGFRAASVPPLRTASAVPTTSIAAGAIIALEPSQIERPGSPSMTCWRSKGRSPGFQSDAVWTTR